jgi:hypothetical protein
MDLKSFTELLQATAWPLVVVAVMFRYQKPLSVFLAGVGQRVTKFSVFEVAIELAALPGPPSPWSDANLLQSSKMRGGEVDSTALMELFNHIKADTEWDYLVVDIRAGRFWFISRLFIFSIFLQAMRNLKCIVFVQSSGEHRQRLLGISSPAALRAALGQAFPWMETALTNALRQHMPNFIGADLPSTTAGDMVRTFIEDRDIRLQSDPEAIAEMAGNLPTPNDKGPTSPVKPEEWVRLGEQDIWEHTLWLDLNISQVNEAVTRSFYEYDSSHYVDSPNVSSEERTRQILSSKAPYIAVVNSRYEFIRLLDRQKLAAMVGDALAQQ